MFCQSIFRVGSTFLAAILTFSGIAVSKVAADPATGWDIGQRIPDFAASFIDEQNGASTSMTWYDEVGADAYALSLCGMWCGPCQLFAEDSATTAAQLQNEGINVQMYDLVYQNVASQEPELEDIQQWIDHVWTSDPENVLFGGDIPLSAQDSIAEELLLRSNFGIPAFVIADRDMVITNYQFGYSGGTGLMANLRAAAIPEPSAVVVTAPLAFLISVRRRRES